MVRSLIFDTCKQECYIALGRAIAERETSLMHTNKTDVCTPGPLSARRSD